MAKTATTTKTLGTDGLKTTKTLPVPRTTDRRLYAKFEVPFATGQTSVSVLIPLSEATPGTTVTVTITHDAV